MSIKVKIGLIILGLFLLLGCATLCIHHYLILPGFYSLEKEEARKDISRVILAIQREIHHIDALCHDWAAWDDTYDFIKTGNQGYIQTNLTQSTFIDNRLSLVCYVNEKGEIVWKGERDYLSGKQIEIKEFSVDSLAPGHPLFSFELKKTSLSKVTHTGILMTEQGPMLIASRPILNSNNQGPVRGAFIMGRFFRTDTIRTLMEQTQVRFQIEQMNAVHPDQNLRSVSADGISEKKIRIIEKDAKTLMVSAVVHGIGNHKALKISADIPRRIAAKGETTTLYALGFALSAGCIMLVMLYLVLQRFIMHPISTLIDHILLVGKTNDLSRRMDMPGNNEISILAREFDNMLEQLGKRREEFAGLNRALKKNQDWLAGILHSVHDAIIIWDDSCRITWANQIAIETFQRKLSGKECHEVFSFEDGACPVCHVKNCFLNGSSHTFELKFMDKNGVSVEYWCRADVAIRRENGSPESVIVLYHDVTEKKRLKAESLRKSQLASIGELAAGVAHEINNPVNGLINYAQILVNECEQEHLAHEIALRMLKEGDRIASIVKSLLLFSRESKSGRSAIHIPAVMAEVFSLIGTQLEKDGILLNSRLAENLPAVKANFQQIQQVLLNLIANSRYALNLKYSRPHANKHLDITCEKVETEKTATIRIIVQDMGVGIPNSIREKVMEPFFSTKPIGVGTGLGLSISHGIIMDHGGIIRIESREGEYTSVIIDLPARG